ncbi:MAG TPA: class I SAM-dependent RNA methyltransferase [Candidatus Limnocylindria bacterium]|nr:class I SAM-dependent RNA methyltransferase [Candidatus Limnocylindria bacterium]
MGDRIELTITDLAFGGEGVGRIDELVVFVPFVLPGERVEAKITEIKRSFARGVLARVLTTSPERVEPRCAYFGECGGCQYQHLDYAAQLRWKHKQIKDLFQRVGGLENVVVHEVIPCPKPYGYRNRILVRSQWNKPAQTLNLGFIRHDCGLVADITSCAIAEEPLNTALLAWRADPPPKGGLKTLLRIPAEGWDVPEHSFFQNNFYVLPKLVEAVRSRLVDAGTRHLVDVYCGVGFFSIELANAVESFVGVELDAPAIKAARRNQACRGIHNGEYVAGDTDVLLPQLLQRLDASKSTVLLDPPRTGCHPPSIELLRRVGPAQIIYVSCHPATLARDLKALCLGGRYRLAEVQPVDMFPQTQHVECVADLRLAGPWTETPVPEKKAQGTGESTKRKRLPMR